MAEDRDNSRSPVESSITEVARGGDDVDCLVIGSGTAGVTTALALADQGFRVVIVEAGPLGLWSHVANARFGDGGGLAAKVSNSAAIPVSWFGDEQAGDGETGWQVPTWLAVGGRTLYWSGTTPRYQAWDFDDWPITADEMARFYVRAESLIKVSGSGDGHRPPFYQSGRQRMAIEQLLEAGWPARSTPAAVDTSADRTLGAGFDSSTARLLASDHLGDFSDGARVSLIVQAVVTRLVLEADRLTGVEVLDRRNDSAVTLRARHVVLACGAVQSARLALRSGLGELNPHVGRYISDHLFLEGVVEFGDPGPDGPFSLLIDPTPDRAYQVQIQGCLGTSSYYKTPSGASERGTGPALVTLAAFGVGAVRREHRVALSSGGDRAYGGIQDLRVIYGRSADDEACLAAMRDGAARAVEAFGARLSNIQVHPPGIALHEVGGLRMSGDEQTGVTDTFGQFWRVRNLSAADASVFPSQGAANPYLTITALSLRHAEALSRRL